METAYIEVYDCRDMGNPPLSGAATKSALAGKKENDAKKNKSTIQVQFNPSSLQFSSAGASADKASDKEKSDVSKNEDGATRTAPADNDSDRICMRLKLIFDRTIYEDCSVQPEVERFIAIVRNPYVRQAAFYWGTMCYSGVVKGMDAEYVLFNEEGIPMRAEINFSIEIV